MYCNHIEQPVPGSLSLQSTLHNSGTAESCTVIAISAGSERFAVAGLDSINIFNAVELLTIERSFLIPKKQGKSYVCKSLCFSHCGRYLLSYFSDPCGLYIWDLVNGAEAKRCKMQFEVGHIQALPSLDTSVFLFIGTVDSRRVIHWFDWQAGELGHLQSFRNDKGNFNNSKGNATNQPTTQSYFNLLAFTILADGSSGCDLYLLDQPSSTAAKTQLMHYKLSPPPPPSNITMKRQQQHLHWIYELQKHRTYTFSLDTVPTVIRMIALPGCNANDCDDAKLAMNLSNRQILIFSLHNSGNSKDPITVLRVVDLPSVNMTIISLFALSAVPDQYDPDANNSSSATVAIGIIVLESVGPNMTALSTMVMKPTDRFWQHKSPISSKLKGIHALWAPPIATQPSASHAMNRLQFACLEGTSNVAHASHAKRLWIFRRSMNSSFAGAMFPVGYRTVRTSCTYEEKEDEFDRVIADAMMMDVEPVRQPIDCTPLPLQGTRRSNAMPLQLIDNGVVNKRQQQDKNQAQEGRARSNLQAWARRQRSLREGKGTEDTAISSRSSSRVKKQPMGYNPFAISSAAAPANSLSSSTANASAMEEEEAVAEEQVIQPQSQAIDWTIEMILPPPSTRIFEQHQVLASRPGLAATLLAENNRNRNEQLVRKHVENIRLNALDRMVKNELHAFIKSIKSKERIEKKRIGKEMAMQQLMQAAAAPLHLPQARSVDESLRLYNQRKQSEEQQVRPEQQKQSSSRPSSGYAATASIIGAGDTMVRMEVGAVLHSLLERIEK